jgi:hypothetical protein
MLTLEQIVEGLRDAPPPTSDDVSVTLDGRRIDTREKVLAWVAEMNAARASEHDAAGA